MALLPLQSSYFISTTKLTPNYLFKSLINSPTKTKFIITFQDTSSKPTIEQPSSSNARPATSSGQGFGSRSGSEAAATSSKGGNQETGKKKKGKKKERATIIRRSPVGTPAFTSDSNKKGDGNKELNSNDNKDQSLNESAFLLAWLALGSLILVQGIALAASGFLPQEWDKFFVKFLYPSFTPTVFLFVAGTVVYGVIKYLQNESLRNPK